MEEAGLLSSDVSTPVSTPGSEWLPGSKRGRGDEVVVEADAAVGE